MIKTKAVVIKEAGGPEKFIYEDVATPEVKEGWSLVKVKCFGINHSEIFTRKGLSPSVKFPRILGIECVGVINKTTDSDRLPVGQKVVSIMGEWAVLLTAHTQNTPYFLISSCIQFRLTLIGQP